MESELVHSFTLDLESANQRDMYSPVQLPV